MSLQMSIWSQRPTTTESPPLPDFVNNTDLGIMSDGELLAITSEQSLDLNAIQLLRLKAEFDHFRPRALRVLL